ncbi:hypothetical protein C2G38_2066010 [Gigaspora rosea]|uniref:Uncharacterized protein n=1 Tax=Gigaspora rosea TaxID=44941 RepID=A0A397VYE1_9GLOM|nr:hypothetical protein C2G38_2066010 [Gigaspora rosea]
MISKTNSIFYSCVDVSVKAIDSLSYISVKFLFITKVEYFILVDSLNTIFFHIFWQNR